MQSEEILVLEKVDSTNNYAMGLIRKGELMNGHAVFALEQTEGKGRRGKEWTSVPGENVLLSIAIEMGWQPLLQQFPVSVATALGCYDLISTVVKEKVYLKWPNDIYIHDSKTAGVLIENVIKGTLWQWAVIGIGMNINQVNFDNPGNKAVSIKLLTGKSYAVIPFAESLRVAVLKRIEQLKEGGFLEMLAEYNQHLYARNKKVRLKEQNRIFETTVLSVSKTGELIAKDVFERHFRFDEVSFLGLV